MDIKNENFLDVLSVEIIKYGIECGLDISITRLPDRIWVDWEDGLSGESGTAEIDYDSALNHGDPPHNCALSFVNFLCDLRYD